MNREPFHTRIVYLVSEEQRSMSANILKHLPVDPVRPLEIVIRERQRKRKADQNALMWAGPLHDIERQVFIRGRYYDAKMWHEYFKQQFLPEQAAEGLTTETYRKWDTTPLGDRVLIGSTTDLLVKGFSEYMEQVYAFGAEHGVKFSAVVPT